MNKVPILAFLLISCKPVPTPTPTPNPTPTPTPIPSPTPVPTECPFVVDELWTPTLLKDDQLKSIVRLAQEDLGSVCEEEPLESLKLLCNRINAMGYPTVITNDAVFIQRPTDGLWEQHHAVYYGSGCWLSNTWKAVWAKENE